MGHCKIPEGERAVTVDRVTRPSHSRLCSTALSPLRESHSITGACGIRGHVKAHVVLGDIEHSKFQKPSYISLIYTYKGDYFQFGQLVSDKNENALT